MIAASGDKVVVGLGWREETAPGEHRELFQVITMRAGKIVTIQDYRRGRKALSALY